MQLQLIIAIAAQITSLITSIIIIITLPGLLGIEEYGLLQFYILIIGYSGIFHLGFNDGAYIYLAGENSESNKTKRIKKITIIYITFQVLIALIVAGFAALYYQNDKNEQWAVYLAAVSLPAINTGMLFMNILQATGENNKASICVISGKLLSIAMILTMVSVGSKSAISYIAALLISAYITAMLSINYLNFKKDESVLPKNYSRLIIAFIKKGKKILVANYVTLVVNGGVLLYIKYKYGIREFSTATLAFSVVSVFVLLISQFGNVAFHKIGVMVKRKEGNKVKDMTAYVELAILMSMATYFFMREYIIIMLPEYKNINNYFIILYAFIAFEGFNQGYNLPILKAKKNVNAVLQINIVAVFIAAFLIIILIKWDVEPVFFVFIITLTSFAKYISLTKESYNYTNKELIQNLFKKIAIIAVFYLSILAVTFMGPLGSILFLFFILKKIVDLYIKLNEKNYNVNL